MSGFVPLPREWRERKRGLSLAAQALYVELLARAEIKTGTVRSTVRALAEDTGASRSAVHRALGSLDAAGVIDYTPARSRHEQSTIVVLLRHIVPPAGRKKAPIVPPAGQQRDDSGTIDGFSPAETPPLASLASLEQSSSEYPEHVREAAHSLSRWSSKQITPAAVAKAAADNLPSELRHAVENLCGRDPSSVGSPLAVLKLALTDERNRRDSFA